MNRLVCHYSISKDAGGTFRVFVRSNDTGQRELPIQFERNDLLTYFGDQTDFVGTTLAKILADLDVGTTVEFDTVEER
jgi:hypothetical protein